MTAPVRPQVWPPAQTDIRPGRNDTRMAAQKAFFDAALAGKPKPSAAPAASELATSAASPAQAVRSVAAAEARATDRLPPPGSIVNILV
jgi:hypothetical protein